MEFKLYQIQVEVYSQKSDYISLGWRQEKFRAREILEVLSTESYRTDSRISLDTSVYRRRLPSPPPASQHHSQEGTNQPHDQSTYYYGIIIAQTYGVDCKEKTTIYKDSS